jgi:hypothetical protein
MCRWIQQVLGISLFPPFKAWFYTPKIYLVSTLFPSTCMSIGWWITQQQEQQQKRTPTAVRLARKLHLERPPTDPKGHIKEALAFKP